MSAILTLTGIGLNRVCVLCWWPVFALIQRGFTGIGIRWVSSIWGRNINFVGKGRGGNGRVKMNSTSSIAGSNFKSPKIDFNLIQVNFNWVFLLSKIRQQYRLEIFLYQCIFQGNKLLQSCLFLYSSIVFSY